MRYFRVAHPTQVSFLSSLAAATAGIMGTEDEVSHRGELSDLSQVVTSLGPATCTRHCDSYRTTVNYRHVTMADCPNWSM